ncbi:uracil phosphoribosyltransferase [Nibricoccus sp. IMCC34717]|uniref:uracil phosphoribosyltransferase n=1 Tax=Nibricoccus sp. IMCC34717 TaxID=3034021 RepID=UPI00384D7B02
MAPLPLFMPLVNTRHSRPRLSIRADSRPAKEESRAEMPTTPATVATASRPSRPLSEAIKALEPVASGDAKNARLIVAMHPVAQHALGRMRQLDTRRPEYRQSANRLLTLVLAEATQDLPLRVASSGVKTNQLARPIVLLAAGADGLGLVREACALFPAVAVGNFGHGITGSEIRLHLPQAPVFAESTVIVVDPILKNTPTTRGIVQFLRQQGVASLRLVGLVGAKPSLDSLLIGNPGLEIFVGAVDTEQNDRGIPEPGIGDFPARYHGE